MLSSKKPSKNKFHFQIRTTILSWLTMKIKG
jgi:hypothetical protein